MSSRVAFILGYGKGIGLSVARKFKAEGFRVAAASRSIKPDATADYDIGVSLDLSKAEDIPKAFKLVEDTLGVPSVVVYNAAAVTGIGAGSDPLVVTFDQFRYDTTITGISAFEVAKQANEAFDKLGSGSRVFIGTGNILPWVVMPMFLGLSVGKRVMAGIVETAATAYENSGKRWYFASQVSPEGKPPGGTDGESHAVAYWRLYEQAEQGPWDVRFVKGGDIWTA